MLNAMGALPLSSKNQRVKRLKKTVKETSSKQAKSKKHIKAKNKSTTLKKTQLIKDIFDKSDGCVLSSTFRCRTDTLL
jgi:hypothetical protein